MNYEQLVTAIDVASQALLGRAAKANQALVLRNWLIGAHSRPLLVLFGEPSHAIIGP